MPVDRAIKEYLENGGVIQKCKPVDKTTDRAKINKERDMPVMKKIDGFSCDICSRRPKCKSLCPPMEWHLSSIEVDPSKEKISSTIDYRQAGKPVEPPSNMEIIYQLYFLDGQSAQQIADTLYVSHSYVCRKVREIKAILRENLGKNALK